jgi:hypothetical protein
MNKENIAYEILGVATWDYIELYRWYAPGGKSQESYKLDSIANVEIGENKLSYDEYDNLFKLISTKSKDITVSDDKPKEKLEEFEKWIRLKNMLKKSLDNE